MRFYKGYLLEFSSAVSPIDDNVSYYVLDVPGKNNRKGIIKFGYEREEEIGRGSVICIEKRVNHVWKRYIRKIHFQHVNGRYEFDLLDFLHEKGIRYKLYKRYDLYESCRSSDMIISAYGEVYYGCCHGYSEIHYGGKYYCSIHFYKKDHMITVDGKKVMGIYILSKDSNKIFEEPALEWCQQMIEQAGEYSSEGIKAKFDELEINKDSVSFQIVFADGGGRWL